MQSRDRTLPLVSFPHYGGGASRADGLSLPLCSVFCVLREWATFYFFLKISFTFSDNTSVSFQDCTRAGRQSHGRPRRGFVRPAKRG